MAQSLQELINAYCNEPTPGLRNAIITEAMPLVKSITGKVHSPDTPLSQYEDLKSAGIMGLLQALDNYDCSKSIKFNTFAYYRIRGNIIDYLRSIDKVPRSDRQNYGQAQQNMRKLQQELGREPTDEEMAESLEMSVEKYHKLLGSVQQRAHLSLDYDINQGEGTSKTALSATIEDKSMRTPDSGLESESISSQLKDAIKDLKERDRLILALYYYEDLTLNEIALLLGLTEARISQLVGKLLMQLKSTLSMELVS